LQNKQIIRKSISVPRIDVSSDASWHRNTQWWLDAALGSGVDMARGQLSCLPRIDDSCRRYGVRAVEPPAAQETPKNAWKSRENDHKRIPLEENFCGLFSCQGAKKTARIP